VTIEPSFADQIIQAAQLYVREHPGATWQSVADAMDAKLGDEGAAWFRAHPELTVEALAQATG
jgi:hypothetical protein